MKNSWSVHSLIRKDDLQFTIKWSPWGFMEKWVVNSIVPSESGLFQLWVKSGRSIVLLLTDIAWYGGLRNCLREALDPMAYEGSGYRKQIAGRETWFRFSTSSHKYNLTLLKQYFTEHTELFDTDGREIFVNEVDSDSKFALPPSEIQHPDLKRLKDTDFGHRIPPPL